MDAVIVKYNAGNIRSVLFALERLGKEAVVTDDPATICEAPCVIFPGVGHAGSAMAWLQERGLDEVLRELQQPVLGICLGMQLLCSWSEEGGTKGMGVFPEQVRRFPLSEGAEKVPHMGWDRLRSMKGPLFDGLEEGAYVYFVHSYYVEEGPATIATVEHILPFSAALQRDNFYAVQFHPERSAENGERILRNFFELGDQEVR